MTDQGGLADPFFDVVRERHTGVDVVLLAPPTRSAPVEDPISLDQARTIMTRVRTAFESLRPTLGDRNSHQPVAAWRSAPAGGWSCTTRIALRGVGGESGRERLRRLASHLHRRGWAVRAREKDAVVVLQCTNGWLDVEARTGPAATTVVLASPPVAIRDADLTALRTEARAG